MKKNSKRFGERLKKLRVESNLSLREMSKLTGYDPSNLSKIERGRISPPSDEKILNNWAKILGIGKSRLKLREFTDEAQVAQGIIPGDILEGNKADYFPAFFRTIRNRKPSKEELDRLIELIRNA
ncbi:MAG: transcriptional regulator [Patescibacteria group bacterium]|nr:transcriptional regulator [Patescibacteria group bacterium]